MPGVPSSRGCGACRKQKKKCDQTTPSCGRCTRLQIPCVGSGQKRYKFTVHTGSLHRDTSQAARAESSAIARLSRAPSNEMTLLSSAIASSLQISDPKYDLSCYGDFMKDIPKRLGSNEALDAAVAAITKAHASFRSRQESIEVLAAYTRAITTLRVYVQDPRKAQTADTLCAIWLIMVCQGWMAQSEEEGTSHGEAMANIMDVAASGNWSGSFERQLLITMCFPVILESILNPRIRLYPWLSKLNDTYGPQRPAASDGRTPIQSLSMQNLARLAELVRNPELHRHTIRMTHELVQAELRPLRQGLDKVANTISPSATTRGTSVSMSMKKVHSRYQLAYSLILSIAIVLKTILRALEPPGTVFVEELHSSVDEVLLLAKQAFQYRPLGASYMPLCLIVAWAAAGDMPQRSAVEEVLMDYQTDFPAAGWINRAYRLRDYFEGLRFKLTADNLEMSVDVSGRGEIGLSSDA